MHFSFDPLDAYVSNINGILIKSTGNDLFLPTIFIGVFRLFGVFLRLQHCFSSIFTAYFMFLQVLECKHNIDYDSFLGYIVCSFYISSLLFKYW